MSAERFGVSLIIALIVLLVSTGYAQTQTTSLESDSPASALHSLTEETEEGGGEEDSQRSEKTPDADLSSSLKEQDGQQHPQRRLAGISPLDFVLGVAALLVAVATLAFTIAMTYLYRVSRERYTEADKKIERKLEELRSTSSKLEDLEDELDIRIEAVRKELVDQEEVALATRRFATAVRERLFELLVGVVENLGTTLQSDQERYLKALIAEAEACLSLFSPDQNELRKALWRLREIGSSNCISPLQTLIDNHDADCDDRLEAQAVLQTILPKIRHDPPHANIETTADDGAGSQDSNNPFE